jgi:hypothetical protein
MSEMGIAKFAIQEQAMVPRRTATKPLRKPPLPDKGVTYIDLSVGKATISRQAPN